MVCQNIVPNADVITWFSECDVLMSSSSSSLFSKFTIINIITLMLSFETNVITTSPIHHHYHHLPGTEVKTVNCKTTWEGTFSFTYEVDQGGGSICTSPQSAVVACQEPGSVYVDNQVFTMNFGKCQDMVSSVSQSECSRLRLRNERRNKRGLDSDLGSRVIYSSLNSKSMFCQSARDKIPVHGFVDGRKEPLLCHDGHRGSQKQDEIPLHGERFD